MCPSIGRNTAGPSLLTGTFPIVAVNLGFGALLYFFALTPIGDRYLKRIGIPCGSSAPLVEAGQRELVITLDAQGQGYIDTRLFTPAELDLKLLELGRRGAFHHIVVRADASLSFAAIRHVLRSASGAGFAQITLLTSEGHWPCGAT